MSQQVMDGFSAHSIWCDNNRENWGTANHPAAAQLHDENRPIT